MITDFRTLGPDAQIATDVCVIGAGAAGITVARALGAEGKNVVLLESGGLEIERTTQALYEGHSAGQRYFDLAACRLRYFGGATNHWAGQCGPLDPLDFEPRSWVPNSGWPLRRDELDPYYQEAHRVCELGPYRYDPETWSDPVHQFPLFEPAKLETCFWQFSPPTRFGIRYRDELAATRRVRVYLHVNLVQLSVNESARQVVRAELRSLQGQRGHVTARRFVLACGGIENPRILLASNRTQSAGLGNGRDLVGRFFMDHPHIRTATILPADPTPLLALYDEYLKDGRRVRGGIHPTAAAQRRERTLNYSANISDVPQSFTGFDALRHVGGSIRRLDWPDALARSLGRMLGDLDQTVGGLAARMRGRRYERPMEVMLFTRSEQAPNPDSRITLGAARDALGMPKAQLEWRLSSLDKHSIRRVNHLIAQELGRLGLGRVKLPDWLLAEDTGWPDAAPSPAAIEASWEALRGGCHHMGTTRMADDPSRGVVDRNCRVHGVANLYVAGSSVFPTSGYVNPTLTIVALSLRLADHLRRLG